MQITSQQQLLQHIGNGGLLKLGDQGQVQSQSGAGRFFQNIADKFRSLSARGRNTIETRQQNLHNAVTEMLRRDPNFNPVGNNGDVPPLQQEKLQTLGMDISIARATGKLPASARESTRNLMKGMMLAHGYPGNHSAAEISGKSAELAQAIKNNAKLSKALKFSGTKNTGELKGFIAAMTKGIEDTCKKQLGVNSTFIQANGMHSAYAKDAGRGNVGTINGHPHMNGHIPSGNSADTLKELEREFGEFIPEQFSSYKPVISMLMSQAGTIASLAITQETATSTCLENYTNIMDLVESGLTSSWRDHNNSVSFEGNKAILHCDTEQRLSTMNGGKFGLHGELPLAQNHYSATLELDMSQPWQPGIIPTLTLTELSVRPTSING